MISALRKCSDRKWYLPFVTFLAAADAFVLFIPTDGLLVTAVLAKPKAWVAASLLISLGSAVGAMVFGYLVSVYGESIITHFFPKLLQSHEWIEASKVIRQHGFWGLAVISLSPFPQHAAVAVAGIVHLEPMKILFSVLIGRTLKYLLVSWLFLRVPQLIKRNKSKQDYSPPDK